MTIPEDIKMKLEKPHYIPGQELEDGTLYVGIINDGEKCYHLSVCPDDYSFGPMTWHEAHEIAGLPTIQEMNLISANAKSIGLDTNENYYWSSTELNTNFATNFAWYERFSDGNQSYYSKNTPYYVRCVRRYSIIQSLDHLIENATEELKHDSPSRIFTESGVTLNGEMLYRKVEK